MKRYREDYRNPSTHDYKLDFDENEAMLAVLSVSAFAKLLVSQMKAKIQSETLKNDPDFKPAKVQQKSSSVGDFAEELSFSLQQFLNNESETARLASREPLALVTAFLEKSGLHLTKDVYMESNQGWFDWDLIVTNKAGFKVPIEVKTSRGRYSPAIAESRIAQVKRFARAGDYQYAVLVEGAGRGVKYVCEKVVETEQLTLHRVGRALETAEQHQVPTGVQ